MLVNIPYFEKQSSQFNKNLITGATTITGSDSAGLGDLDLRFRYNLWRSIFFDKWITLYAATTLPTGKFDKVLVDSPGLQIGTGAPSFTGGLLFSYNWGDFWFHSSATYTGRLENSDDYRYGNELAGGVAFHYTPTYDYMIGVEVDAAYSEKNENRGVKVGNTGGTRTNLALVGDWRFLTALGGNFSLRAAVGVPIYEDLNHQTVGTSEQVQLGGGFFGNLAVSYATRFPFFE
jgi:hypothetical protein